MANTAALKTEWLSLQAAIALGPDDVTDTLKVQVATAQVEQEAGKDSVKDWKTVI